MRRLAIVAMLIALAAPLAGAQCICDCDDDGRVAVNDLLRLVSLSFAPDEVDRCPRFLGIWIQIHDLVSCVDAALNRAVCSRTRIRSATPTPTSTESAAPTPSATPRSTETPSPTSTPSSEDEAAAALAREILEQIAAIVCSTSITPGGGYSIHGRDAGATLDCRSFTGHNGRFDLVRHPSAAAADLAFGTPEPEEDTYSIGGGSMRELRWKPPCCPNLGGVSTRWKWQRDCWVAAGNTFDDTHFILSPQGPIVVDALVESGRLDDLTALCPQQP